MYIPSYYDEMAAKLTDALKLIDEALDIVFDSLEYNDESRCFHKTAVANVNHLRKIALELDGYTSSKEGNSDAGV